MSQKFHFLLNDREIDCDEAPGLLLLDYLRHKARLMGTKEGCKEGDCGACTVLVGELNGDKVRYLPETSCLIPIGEMRGKHVVTVEGLNMEALSLVQQAIVDEGGSQCGFCTPGIVVSLTALLLREEERLDKGGIKKALSGHLWRCTGYSSLKRAGDIMIEKLAKSGKLGDDRVADMVSCGVLPAYFSDIPGRLKALPKQEVVGHRGRPHFFIAGGTDIYVQRGEDIPASRVALLNQYPEMRGITRDNGHLHLGALTTFEELGQSKPFAEIVPAIADYMNLVASWQVRNRATIGGNIVNASPIGDVTILFLALGAALVLIDPNNGTTRTVALNNFYKGYKSLDKSVDEIVTEIVVPVPTSATQVDFEKVSKRKHLDIATANSAIKIRCDGNVISDISLAAGGVAPIPLLLRKTSDYLVGKTVGKEAIAGALAVAQEEISPISDVRGSAEYKRLLIQQFLIAHFVKLFPETVKVQDFCE